MDNKMEFEGYVDRISSESIRKNGDKVIKSKQVMVCEHKGDYPQQVALEINEKLYNMFILGERVLVKFNVYSWEYNGLMFNKMRAWACTRFGKDDGSFKRLKRRYDIEQDKKRHLAVDESPVEIVDKPKAKEKPKKDKKESELDDLIF